MSDHSMPQTPINGQWVDAQTTPELSGDPGALSPVKRALVEIKELRARLEQVEQAAHEPLAIVGMGLRLPGGVTDAASFWAMLRDGIDAITPIPRDRWDVDAFYSPDPNAPGKMSTRGGGFLVDVDQFEPHFFGISPREAASMDPQQRLLLETTWEAFEHAGQPPDALKGSATGVFVGITNSDYGRLMAADPADIDVYFATGASFSVAAGRLAYVFGLQGPCMAVDTACSSSLLAVHLACQSLRNRECNLAIAGGVNLILAPEANINLTQAHMMAGDDRCKTFDAAADGYVRGEGCAVIVIKRLADARANGDSILALIRGSAVNQDGRSNGLTAPNGPAQRTLIQQALTNARVEPNAVDYVEAHGTGTPLGDPIELQALAAVYGQARRMENPLWIGSVKTNIGHLESAAGIAGLLKNVLALQHQQIPPHLHFHQPTAHIPWATLPLAVPTTLRSWPATGTPRRAGVSSFGFSGTNVHLILEEAPPRAPAPPSPHVRQLLTLSARNRTSLARLAERMAERVAEVENASTFADLCYTANAGRSHHTQRVALPIDSAHDAESQLRILAADLAAGQQPQGIYIGEAVTAQPPKVAWLFTGQGAQMVGMGRELYAQERVFREVVDECGALLAEEWAVPLVAVLYGEDAQVTQLLDQTRYTQPALFAVEVGLARLWQAWGVTPVAVMGHSVGELAAACVAGVMSLAEGLRLVAARARLMGALPAGGTMAVVQTTAAAVTAALAGYEEQVAIAAYNGPEQTVISGAGAVVEAVLARFAAVGVGGQRLRVSHAFHSPLMGPMVDEFAAVAASIRYESPQLPLISNVRGAWFGAGEVPDAAYWVRHVLAPVDFVGGMQALRPQAQLFLEIGPQPVLVGMGRRCVADADGAQWLASLKHNRDDRQQMLESLAALYVQGVPIDWSGFYADQARQRVALPTYPFDHQSYWIARDPVLPARATDPSSHAPVSKLAHLAQWSYLPTWEREPICTVLEPAQPMASDGARAWLILTDVSGLGTHLAADLVARGEQVTLVYPGAEFAQMDDATYALDPTDEHDYTALCAALAAHQRLPHKIIDCRALDFATEEVSADALSSLFFGPLYLARALNVYLTAESAHLYLLSSGAVEVTGNEVLRPEQAVSLGLARVLAQEVPNLHCYNCDLEHAGDHALRNLAGQLRQVFEHEHHPAVIAYRGAYRWRPRYQPIPLAVADSPRLRAGGVYLITGGLGGIGFVLAQHLAATLGATLILTGRTELPPRENWSQWLADHPTDERVSRRIQRAQSLEAAGAHVWMPAVDVGDEAQMHALMREIQNRYGALHGVIHAAGVVALTPVPDLDAAAWEDQRHAKVRGVQVLAKVLDPRVLDITSPDFCLLMSSLSALLGGLGMAAYAAANAYLDAYAWAMHRATEQRQGTMTWISVNWDTWQMDDLQRDAREWVAGMGATLAELSMQPAEGIELFQRVLAAAAGPQVIVSVGDLAARQARWVNPARDSTADARTHKQAATVQQPRPGLTVAYAEPVTALQAQIAGIWEALLGIAPIGINDNFFELGGDSLLATQVIQRLRVICQADLPVRTLFEAMTVAQLADTVAAAQLAASLCASPALTLPVSSKSELREEVEL